MKSLGDNLRYFRTVKGLKQEMVAEYLGISTTTYGAYERNENNPSVERLKQIAELFETNLSNLINYDIKDENIQKTEEPATEYGHKVYSVEYWKEKYYNALEQQNQLNRKIAEEKDKYIKLLSTIKKI